jgi:predicted unusual protein kinase regulating ubiquinone biosynthesis (AarF/ABC1/UbiB family)
MDAAPQPDPRLGSDLVVRRRRLETRFMLRAWGVTQGVRLAAAGGAWAWAELAGAAGDLVVGGRTRARRRRTRQISGAQRIAGLLGELKGPFAKAGQFASLRVDVLEPEIREAFATLRDRVPPLPIDEIAAVVEEDLGAPLARLFAEFEPDPLGAASVAQVHRARLFGGERVAVKIQYPWLARSLRADLAWTRRLLGWLVRSAAGHDRDRLFDEFAAGLADELDFAREARVAGEIAANLAGDPQVVVPRVHPALSSRRVLTVDWMPVLPLHDRSALERRGVPLGDVVTVLGRAYAKQVFVDGLFHADPHPGNLFILDEPDAAVRPRLLFVDFGLSKRLEPTLRREMRLGVLALLRHDTEAFVAGMDRVGMIAPGARGGVREAVEQMIRRIEGHGSALGLGGAQILALKDEAKQWLERTPGLQLPAELLLWAKTLSYLFALGEQLDPDTDLARTTLPYLLRWLAARD